MKYVIHFCKNKKCNASWIDKDLTNAKSRPPQWKYCKKCCVFFGYINPEKPLKREMSEKQSNILKLNRKSYRKEKKII